MRSMQTEIKKQTKEQNLQSTYHTSLCQPVAKTARRIVKFGGVTEPAILSQKVLRHLNGAKILLETLKSLGTDTVFGYPGGIVLNIYDELYKQSDIKHILSRHEQASVHEAEGYARVTGKCGVVVVTSGPGATNIVTGVANAYMDGYPLLILTGQVSKDLIGKDAFQEIDIANIVKPCTKAVFQVTECDKLEETIIKAYEVAMSGKKAPVLVDIAKNVFAEQSEYKNLKPQIRKEYQTINVDKVISAMKYFQKPVIVAGGGVKHSDASELLFQFAQKCNIPVVNTMMGLGTFPKSELYFGMLGIYGNNAANEIIKKSDLIISLGARFNDRIHSHFEEFELQNKIIQVDINKTELARVLNPIMTINADISCFLNELLKYSLPNFTKWCKSAQELKKLDKPYIKTSEKLESFEVIKVINNYIKDKNITITTEVGQHQLWSVKGLDFSFPEQLLTSGGSGTMGFGFPAAIGASIAKNGAEVICITGDGSLQMNLQELATCKEYNLPIKIFVFNNGNLGMVRQLQEINCEGRYSQTKLNNPDFLKIASAYGIEATRVTKSKEILNALNLAFSTNSPFLIDFIIEPNEVV